MINFSTETAIRKLKENRKTYIKRLIMSVNQSIDKLDDYEMASNYIIAAADNLRTLNGALDYLELAEDTYPEFEPVFD